MVAFIGYSLVAKDYGLELKICMSCSNKRLTVEFYEKPFFSYRFTVELYKSFVFTLDFG